jgi:lipopolysaccharide/colanic/teichoic acid biosynthesis glycosyltransferase
VAQRTVTAAGDMSLVGPRPERPEYVEMFEMQIRRYGERRRVKAGVTGWARVHGLRGQTSIADRAEFDNHYIENWSLTLDFKILLTILAILRSAEERSPGRHGPPLKLVRPVDGLAPAPPL